VNRLVAALLLVVLALPLAATAQPAARLPRIGILSVTSRSVALDAFSEGLRTLGYRDGHNIVLEHRSAEGQYERLPELAAELVRLQVDVIAAVVTQASLAAKHATTTIPIVMVAVGDPVGAGLVPSLARPGGNVTGTSFPSVEVAGKSLELLKRVIPKLQRAAVLWNPANPVFQGQMVKETEAAARALGIQLQAFGARDVKEIDRAFEEMAKARPEALIVISDGVFTAHRTRIATLAVKRRLPSVSAFIPYAEAGGLMAYAPDFSEMGLRAAGLVARILQGARPADLPVEQASKIGLVLNLKTAKALGLTIPPALSAQADRVIE
jgi:putative ABC transport system substrate-binding protein